MCDKQKRVTNRNISTKPSFRRFSLHLTKSQEATHIAEGSSTESVQAHHTSPNSPTLSSPNQCKRKHTSRVCDVWRLANKRFPHRLPLPNFFYSHFFFSFVLSFYSPLKILLALNIVFQQCSSPNLTLLMASNCSSTRRPSSLRSYERLPRKASLFAKSCRMSLSSRLIPAPVSFDLTETPIETAQTTCSTRSLPLFFKLAREWVTDA